MSVEPYAACACAMQEVNAALKILHERERSVKNIITPTTPIVRFCLRFCRRRAEIITYNDSFYAVEIKRLFRKDYTVRAEKLLPHERCNAK
jgi:hypothetical protein